MYTPNIFQKENVSHRLNGIREVIRVKLIFRKVIVIEFNVTAGILPTYVCKYTYIYILMGRWCDNRQCVKYNKKKKVDYYKVIVSDDRWTVIINHCACRDDYFRSRLDDSCMSLIKATCAKKVIELEERREKKSKWIMSVFDVISLQTRIVLCRNNQEKRTTPDPRCDHQFGYRYVYVYVACWVMIDCERIRSATDISWDICDRSIDILQQREKRKNRITK